jgi:hypothetical protein
MYLQAHYPLQTDIFPNICRRFLPNKSAADKGSDCLGAISLDGKSSGRFSQTRKTDPFSRIRKSRCPHDNTSEVPCDNCRMIRYFDAVSPTFLTYICTQKCATLIVQRVVPTNVNPVVGSARFLFYLKG